MSLPPKLPPPGPARIAIIGDRPFEGLVLSTYEAALRRVGVVPEECLWGEFGDPDLWDAVLTFDPTICLIVGNRVLSAMKAKKCSVEKWRGTLFKVDNLPAKCLVTLDLNAYIFGSRVTTWEWQFYLQADMRRLAEEARTRELVLPERDIFVAQTDDDLRFAFSYLQGVRKAKTWVSVDLEGYPSNITCIAFSAYGNYATVIPLAHADGTSVWREETEVKIWEEVKACLEDPEVKVVGQNFFYDAFCLAWGLGITVRNMSDDTILAWWELFPEIKKGLATQLSILTKEPYYKPDKGEEGEMRFESDDEFWRYNGLDAAATLECWEKEMAMMTEGQRAHYRFNCELMPALIYMELRGMLWDHSAARVAQEEAKRQAFALQHLIDREACKGDWAKGTTFDLVDIAEGFYSFDPPESEIVLTHQVVNRLCRASIKIPTEVVEERWQPMRWNGRKWVKDGKLTMALEAAGLFHGEVPPSPWAFTCWMKPMPRTLLKNLPFTPSTLDECGPFILESKLAAWARVKELWKELQNEKETHRDHNHTSPDLQEAQTAQELDRGDGETAPRPQPDLPPALPQHAQLPAPGRPLPAQGGGGGDDASGPGVVPGAGPSRVPREGEDAGNLPAGVRPGGGDHQTARSSLLGELSTLLDLAVNTGSTQAGGDAQKFLYETCGLGKKFKKAKGKLTEQVSTDQNALVALYAQSRDVRVLWVLQMRRLRKLVSDLDVTTDDDGRMRTTFSLVKETGRMSASASPTGTGTNLQALNKDLRHLVKADPGCVLFQRDLKGADSWTVAAECAALGDRTMLEDLEAGMRPAEIVALFYLYPSEAPSWDRPTLQAKIKETKPSWPAWLYPGTKAGIHLTSYAGGVPTLVQTLLRNSLSELPLDLGEAKPVLLDHAQGTAIQAAIHRRYPGLKKWHASAEQKILAAGVMDTGLGHFRRFYGRKVDYKGGRPVANHETFKEWLASKPQFFTTYQVKKALWKMWYDPENRLPDGTLRAEPRFAVHDSTLSSVKEADVDWMKAKEKEWFTTPITISGITVTIPSDGQSGHDWGMKD